MRLSASIAFVSLLCLLTACASTHYKVSLRDGREFTTDNKPYFVAKTGYYRYRDLSGKDALVRADEVLMINQL
jgi:hypothetical protein